MMPSKARLIVINKQTITGKNQSDFFVLGQDFGSDCASSWLFLCYLFFCNIYLTF